MLQSQHPAVTTAADAEAVAKQRDEVSGMTHGVISHTCYIQSGPQNSKPLPDNYNTNNNTQDDICNAVYTTPTICESSLLIIWTKVGQRQLT